MRIAVIFNLWFPAADWAPRKIPEKSHKALKATMCTSPVNQLTFIRKHKAVLYYSINAKFMANLSRF